MKRCIYKTLGAVLAVSMAAGTLSGCGAAEDPVKDVMGYSGDTAFFNIEFDDQKVTVTASDYLFWMAQNADYVANYHQAMGMDLDWSSEMGDGTMDDYVKTESQNTAVVYAVVAAKAEEQGYTFTEEDEKEYQDQIAQAKESLGGEEEYANWLKSQCTTEEGMKKLSSVGVLYTHMEDGLLHDGGDMAATGEVLEKFAEDNDLLCAKHILFLTQDKTEEEKQEQLDKANEVLAQLNEITDADELSAKFDELMNKYSEDTGLAANPDGYTFTANEMVPAFEETTRQLEFGEISDIVETDYGYHIIMRQSPVDVEGVVTQYNEKAMDDMLQQWMDEAVVTTTEEYDNLTTADFYEKLTAYRDTFAEKEEEEPAEETSEEDIVVDDAVGEDAIEEPQEESQDATGENAVDNTEEDSSETEQPEEVNE